MRAAWAGLLLVPGLALAQGTWVDGLGGTLTDVSAQSFQALSTKWPELPQATAAEARSLVPENSRWALLATGALALGALRARKRH